MRRNGVSAVQGPGVVNNTCDFWEDRCLSACLMPLKGSGTKLSKEGNGADEKSIILTLTSPTDFIVDPDGMKVECKVCSAGIPSKRRMKIVVRSAAKHLQSIKHFKVVERLGNTKRQQERLEDESGSPSSSLPSAAEVEMWARYEANGADFDTGNDAADANVHHAQLQKQAEVFSLLDAEGVAKVLGFGGDDVAKELLAEDDDEDFLSGIMANIGQSIT
ncbi:hypothetical protein B0H14DRAFT_2594578 [Mycena olivaceomarginata]|nr:hypothetical protein B0H14DRAFT_2594578 [Mycena olivaceomarginata]